MTTLYADSSALVRAYFEDEDDHDALRTLLLESGQRVVTSELARIELASAVRSAAQARRIGDEETFQDRVALDYSREGPLTLIGLDGPSLIPSAYRLVREHRLRTLDAIHLAVALDAPTSAGVDEFVFVTRDDDQAAAAQALGLAVL